MKLKDCIVLAASILNLGGVLQGEELSETDNLLVRCANNCLDEIASEYIPLEKQKQAMAQDGRIPYSELDETVYDVTRVMLGKKDADFRLMPSHIKVQKDGMYDVVYRTRPPILGPDDDLPFPLLVSARIVSYGIAAEYLLINGFYEEAVTWDTRFKDALVRAAYGGREKHVRARRWLI